jgi:hypothetical protein
MSTAASRKILKSLPLLASLALASSAALAQQRLSSPWGIYGGAAFGVGVAEWSSGTTTDRATFSGKLFGGYRMTPGLAAEVNYIWFGGLDRANDASKAAETGVLLTRQKARALTLGVNWEVELLNGFHNQLRAGWAITRKDQKLTLADSSTDRKISYDSSPYVGAGISYDLMNHLRLASGIDWVVNGHDSYYLFSVGASSDF